MFGKKIDPTKDPSVSDKYYFISYLQSVKVDSRSDWSEWSPRFEIIDIHPLKWLKEIYKGIRSCPVRYSLLSWQILTKAEYDEFK